MVESDSSNSGSILAVDDIKPMPVSKLFDDGQIQVWKARAKRYFLILARRAEADPEDAKILSKALGDRISEYWEPALEAAMQASESLDHAQVHPWIDAVIAKSLREKPDLKLVSDLYNRIPLNTVMLKQTSLEVFRQTVKAMEERVRVDLHPAEYLTMLINYVQRLFQLGILNEAESCASKALGFARSRYEHEPEKFKDGLISSLETWAIITSSLGRLKESCKVREETIILLRTLPNQKRILAQSLSNHAGTLYALNDLASALQFSQEAVDIYREFENQRISKGHTDFNNGLQASVDDARPNLGLALISLSTYQNAAQQYQECLNSAQEAFNILFELSEDFPDTFQHQFAMARHNLGMGKFSVGDVKGGLLEMEEATTIYERLMTIHPDVYRLEYAHLLRSMALAHAKNNRNGDAIVQTEKAAGFYRELARQAPDRHAKSLISSLNELKILYEATGQNEMTDKIKLELAELVEVEKNSQ